MHNQYHPFIGMKQFACIFLLSLASLCASCQELPPILKTTQYQPGIYLNYLEFLTNSPSIKDVFTIKETGGHSYLIIKDKSHRKRVKNFWGVSDGKSVFISSSHASKRAYNVRFNELSLLQEINRYCFFVVSHYYEYSPGLRGTSLIPFVLNINNGASTPLTKEIVKKILSDAPDLLNEYDETRRKNNLWVKAEHIKTYNASHQHEIEFKKSAAKVIVFRRSKNKNDKEVRIKKPDGTEIPLPQNSKIVYHSLQPRVNFCVNDICDTFTLSNDSVTYIQCLSSSNKSMVLNKVPLAEGVFYIREIDFKSKKTK